MIEPDKKDVLKLMKYLYHQGKAKLGYTRYDRSNPMIKPITKPVREIKMLTCDFVII